MPAKRVSDGFVRADSHNLPKVDCVMQYCYFNSSEFLSPETRNVKTLRSTRVNYTDNAIGYVQLKREGEFCEVKAEITPEHNIRSGNYHVSCIIDEVNDSIIRANCEDCKAKEGGCKHAIAFVSWLHRRSEEPSVTEVQCYWKKTPLSTVCAKDTFATSNSIKEQKHVVIKDEESQQMFDEACSFLKRDAPKVSLVKQLQVNVTLSLFHLMMLFKKMTDIEHSGEKFVAFCSSQMSVTECLKVAKNTKAQSESSEWFSHRYARISASKLFEVSRCQTPDGSLVDRILGVVKVKTTAAMERGLRLEPAVLKVLNKQMKEKTQKTGFVMCQDYPIFGASPDAIVGDHVVEIKCPVSRKTWETYFKNDYLQPADKYKAQIMLQMLMCNKHKGFFCVADPDFETNQKLRILEVSWDPNFCFQLMQDAKVFWVNNIYPRMYSSI